MSSIFTCCVNKALVWNCWVCVGSHNSSTQNCGQCRLSQGPPAWVLSYSGANVAQEVWRYRYQGCIRPGWSSRTPTSIARGASGSEEPQTAQTGNQTTNPLITVAGPSKLHSCLIKVNRWSVHCMWSCLLNIGMQGQTD